MSSQTIRASNFVVTDSDGRVHGVFGFQRVADGQGDSTLRPTAPKQVKLVNRLPHLELPVGIDVVDYRLREPFSAEFGDNLIADDFMVFPACLDVPRWTKLWESEFSNARHVPNLARRLIRQQQSDESMANRVAQRFFIVESRIKRLETKVGIE